MASPQLNGVKGVSRDREYEARAIGTAPPALRSGAPGDLLTDLLTDVTPGLGGLILIPSVAQLIMRRRRDDGDVLP